MDFVSRGPKEVGFWRDTRQMDDVRPHPRALVDKLVRVLIAVYASDFAVTTPVGAAECQVRGLPSHLSTHCLPRIFRARSIVLQVCGVGVRVLPTVITQAVCCVHYVDLIAMQRQRK